MSVRASIRRIQKFEEKLRGQGRDVRNLCDKSFRLRELQGPNESLKKCYASILGNCTGPISREHYISESILKQLGDLNPDGFPWLKGKSSKIVPNDLVANCLCKYHNEFLGPIDHLAGRSFDSFISITDKSQPCVFIWGPSFARWLLKVLVGLVGVTFPLFSAREKWRNAASQNFF